MLRFDALRAFFFRKKTRNFPAFAFEGLNLLDFVIAQCCVFSATGLYRVGKWHLSSEKFYASLPHTG